MCGERGLVLIDFDQRVAVRQGGRLEQFVQAVTRFVGAHRGSLDRDGAFKCVGAARRNCEFDHHPDHPIVSHLRLMVARPMTGPGPATDHAHAMKSWVVMALA
jgi:hypothetical protein